MNSQQLSQAELLAVHPSCTVKEMEFGKWNRKQESVVDEDREIKTSSNLLFFFLCWKKRKLNLSWPISPQSPKARQDIFAGKPWGEANSISFYGKTVKIQKTRWNNELIKTCNCNSMDETINHGDGNILSFQDCVRMSCQQKGLQE